MVGRERKYRGLWADPQFTTRPVCRGSDQKNCRIFIASGKYGLDTDLASMKNMILLAALLLPLLATAQSQTTAKWTPERRLVLADLTPATQQAVLALPADLVIPSGNLAKACQLMTSEAAEWVPAQDGKSVQIRMARVKFPDMDKESWEIYLTRMAGVYLFPN